MTSGYNINAAMSVFAMALMPVIGGSMFIIQPAFIQGMVAYMGFSEQYAGYAMSIEMTGFALGTILMALIASRINWRHVLRLSMLTTIIATLGCMFVEQQIYFIGLRFVIGLATGAIVSLGFTSIGLTEKAERNFGIAIFLSMIYGAIVLFLLPTLFDLAGLQALLVVIVLLSIIGLIFSKHLPMFGEERRVVEADAVDIPVRLKWLGVVAVLLYFLAQGAVWAYIFLFGTNANLSPDTVSMHLTLSQFTGIAGAMVAVVIGAKYSRLPPLTLGIAAGVIPLCLFLYEGIGPSVFLVGVLIYNFGFNLSHPYLLATMASFDRRGQMVIIAVCGQTLGLALGPAIGASLISGDNYDNIKWFSILFFSLSLLCMCIPILCQHQMWQRAKMS